MRLLLAGRGAVGHPSKRRRAHTPVARLASALALAAALLVLGPLATAAAAPVTVLERDGGAHVRLDPALPSGDALTPVPGAPKAIPTLTTTPSAAGQRALERALARMRRARQISAARERSLLAAYARARATWRGLTGTRRRELGAPIAILEWHARAGRLTAARLDPLFLTLARNREWWAAGRPTAAGQRISFEGSELVFQYYAGTGIQLQMLANFGLANGLWEGRLDARLRRLLDELLALSVRRAGGTAWEYYFPFGGGRPPWTSAMSQGTAIQALSRAAVRLRRPSLGRHAESALALFRRSHPEGVRLARGSDRAQYLLYSFAPDLLVLNGFLQSLIGLYDHAELTDSPLARRLFATGDREARRMVPRYDTGSWSLYDLRSRSTPDYHLLVTQFLERLCERTRATVYCDTAERFASYTS